MARFHFYLREKTSESHTTIQLHVRWDSQRLKFNTGIRVMPNEWNDKKQMIKRSRSVPNYLQHNERLNTISVDAEKVYNELLVKNKREPTASELKVAVQSIIKGDSLKTTLMQFIHSHIQQMEKGRNPKNGLPYSSETLKTYRLCYNKLSDFQKHSNYTIDFDSINLTFHKKFLQYLEKKGSKPNYQGKLIKMLRTFMNEAIEQGFTNNKSHQNRRFYAPNEETIQVYLDIEELNEIREITLTEERLQNARDLFLVGCYTGLRFSDVVRLNKESFTLDKDGNEIIRVHQKKTKKDISIPVLPELKSLLVRRKNELPRGISNQKLNGYIKEICQRIDCLNKQVIISKETKPKQKWEMISSHTARRSFATNAVVKGFSTQLIMNITGHTTETAFYRYIKTSPNENAILFLNQYKSGLSTDKQII